MKHNRSRRSLLKGSLAGAAGLAGVAGVTGAGIFFAQGGFAGAHGVPTAFKNLNSQNTMNGNAADNIQTILNIAATAETLAVTFYAQAVKHANQLGFSANGLLDIEAALIEEQLHLLFLTNQGAKPLTTRFSLPFGVKTFQNLNKFIMTQQQLETLFISAYLAATKEFAMLQRPDLAQIASQIGNIEAEHRAIGRAIGGMRPANDQAFSPALLKKVGDAPAIMKQAGYLSPVAGNMFTFKPVGTSATWMNMTNPSSTTMNWMMNNITSNAAQHF